MPHTEPPNNACSCAHRKDTFQVFLKDLTGRTLTFEVYNEMTTWDFKQAVQHRCGVGPDIMRLIFGGDMLTEDDRTLQDYGVSRERTIHMVLRMCGC